MPISEEKKHAIMALMDEIGISERDLCESFVIGSGKGGQKKQKTHSAVQIKHIPTGLRVSCEKERDRETNRWLARRNLCEKYQEQIHKQPSKATKNKRKIKKQKKRRAARAKKKLIDT